jgi:hypothetical protein
MRVCFERRAGAQRAHVSAAAPGDAPARERAGVRAGACDGARVAGAAAVARGGPARRRRERVSNTEASLGLPGRTGDTAQPRARRRATRRERDATARPAGAHVPAGRAGARARRAGRPKGTSRACAARSPARARGVPGRIRAVQQQQVRQHLRREGRQRVVQHVRRVRRRPRRKRSGSGAQRPRLAQPAQQWLQPRRGRPAGRAGAGRRAACARRLRLASLHAAEPANRCFLAPPPNARRPRGRDAAHRAALPTRAAPNQRPQALEQRQRSAQRTARGPVVPFSCAVRTSRVSSPT